MKEALGKIFKWIYIKRQPIVQGIVLLFASIYFIYALGYTTNWAGVVTETRGASFFRASQQANRLMVDLGFITLLVVLLNLIMGSFTRKKYYLSNFLLSILATVLMIVQAVITVYYNSVISRMYARLSEDEVPSYLYQTHGAGEKSFAVFEQGDILSFILIGVAIILIVFTIIKYRAQKERAKLIKELLVNEH